MFFKKAKIDEPVFLYIIDKYLQFKHNKKCHSL
jgi:hypothetical protein